MPQRKAIADMASSQDASAASLGDTTAPSQTYPLVVDLDATLIKSDLLYESVLRAACVAPAVLFRALMLMKHGKAAVKASLAENCPPDISSLPVNDDCVAYIRAARDSGQRIILASASDLRLVTEVAGQIGLFDEVYGSDGKKNLTGAAKAEALCRMYGDKGFDYVADRQTDFAVWRRARKAITINALPSLQRRLEAIHADVEHITPNNGGWLTRLSPYLRVLRPHQWVKNILIFAPLVTAHRLDAAAWWPALCAFVAFSLAASSVYALNDLVDIESDRAHPRKRKRPFASGAVPIKHGMAMVLLLLLASGALALSLLPWAFIGVLALYYVLTVGYTFDFKRRLIVDVVVLAMLYTMRVVAGAAAAEIILSPWLLALSTFLFLSLAIMKRMSELLDAEKTGREIIAGRSYLAGDISMLQGMATASGYLAVLVLALYISSPAVALLYHSPTLLWGVCPFMLFWISRLLMKTHRGQMHDDPIVYVVRDRISLVTGVCVLAVMVAAAKW